MSNESTEKTLRILHLGDFYSLCEGRLLEALFQHPHFYRLDGVVLTGISTIPIAQHFIHSCEKAFWILQKFGISPDRCIVTPSPKDLDYHSQDRYGLYSRYFYEPLKRTPYVPGVGNSTFWKDPTALQIVGIRSLTHLDPTGCSDPICVEELGANLDVASFVASLDEVSPVKFLSWYHPPSWQASNGLLQPTLSFFNVALVLHGDSDCLPISRPNLGALPRMANLIIQDHRKGLMVKRFVHRGQWRLSHTVTFNPRLREAKQA